MPLKKGSSKAVIRKNTGELATKFVREGRGVKKAYQMAYAASMQKAGKSKKKT